jgi:hypothetical protein
LSFKIEEEIKSIGFPSGTLWSRNIGINQWQSFGFVDCKNNGSP